ncbi:immunity 49 family protein [Streptomyces sp. NPDC057555]|uniref:immunity 49 family protein n=1 Tax=Streptomyces sp. NPDC057555 TaxID=3346166 RepID=UPI0036817FB6
MIQIPRHDVPTRNVKRLLAILEPDLQGKIDDLEEDPEWFSMTLGSALRVFGVRCAEDPAVAELETWESCVTAMQVSSALFVSARATTDTVECLIDHKKRAIRSGAGPWAHAGNWLTAFWLAAVCREKRRLDELCEVPVAQLRNAGGVFDSYIYDWVEALQAYWLKQPQLGDKLVAAVDGTDPDVLRHADADGVLRLMYPPMNLLTQLARGDAEKFNAELAKAIRWHKEYWTDDEDRELDAQGFVALGLTAVSCLARDAGFALTVESEYLPEGLLDAGWVGEFPT